MKFLIKHLWSLLAILVANILCIFLAFEWIEVSPDVETVLLAVIIISQLIVINRMFKEEQSKEEQEE